MAIKIQTVGTAGPVETSASAPATVPVQKKASELEAALKKIRKELGEGSVVVAMTIPTCARLPTGCFEFDLATGGGFPRGRYSIVYGPESSGKTNLLYKAIAQAQRLPPPCNKAVFVDLEGTFDAEWAAKFGVDIEELIVAKPSYGEQAVDMIDAIVRADDVACIGVDSVAVMIAAKEIEGTAEKADVGTSALLIKRLCNKLAVALAEERKRGHEPAVILLNQTRFKIGVMFGDPETMPGGQTLKFNSSLTVRLYGKNRTVKEISSEIPAFKETNASIKKAKVGIVNATFTYDMAMIPHDGLEVGDTDSFKIVKPFLENLGLIQSVKDGYECMGIKFKTLAGIRDLYRAEDSFALQLQSAVIQAHKMSLVADESEGEQ